ncbi:HIN_053947 [Hexamita inflata]|uniref:HIN_053947 n=1 Tax=Hexamita inflata TaxID=28002 RepID=A0ABP1JZ08_9EUKA
MEFTFKFISKAQCEILLFQVNVQSIVLYVSLHFTHQYSQIASYTQRIRNEGVEANENQIHDLARIQYYTQILAYALNYSLQIRTIYAYLQINHTYYDQNSAENVSLQHLFLQIDISGWSDICYCVYRICETSQNPTPLLVPMQPQLAKLAIQAKEEIAPRDITRYVKYPRYIRVQRQKVILQQRMKVPPTVNFFYNPVNKNLNTELLAFAKKYAVETKEVRKARIAKAAEAKTETKAPVELTTGLNAVTTAIERKQAKLVLIACDVDPLELVLYLPTLAHKMQVPFAIVRTKALLGELVHVKNCTCVAITEVKNEDSAALKALIEKCNAEVDYKHASKTYGGNTRSERSINKEAAKKNHKEQCNTQQSVQYSFNKYSKLKLFVFV